jgi:hypothetical protein
VVEPVSGDAKTAHLAERLNVMNAEIFLYRLSGVRAFLIDLFGQKERIYHYTIHEAMFALQVHDSLGNYQSRR